MTEQQPLPWAAAMFKTTLQTLVEGARKEIEHIARQLEDIRKERMRLNRREAELLGDRLEARRRMAKGKAALGEEGQ